MSEPEREPPLLGGAVVQRVDIARALAVLRLRAPGATYFLMMAAGRAGPLVGLARQKPFKGAGLFTAPESALPLGEKLHARSRLEGARVEAIAARSVVLVKEGERFVLETTAASGGRVRLRAAGEGWVLDEQAAREAEVEAWCARGEELSRSFGEGALAVRQQDLARALARAVAKVERRIAAIEGDLARIGAADALAAKAAAFVAEASRAPRGASSLTVTDWSSGEPKPLVLALDPAKSAREQIDAMFKRARRLKQGGVIARQRLAQAEAAWEALGAIAARAVAAASFEAIDGLAREAKAAAPREFALGAGASGGGGGGAARSTPSRPYRVFHGAGGARIFVGKGAAGNDALSFHVAKPHDLWLHAKGRTGAHVIVPLDKGHACPSELLVDAAHLAAHFSEAREEGVVEVEHTPRRYLRKPKGAAPGFVLVDREKVLVLRVERERLGALLAGEEMV
jgi:predicted ribosome quality control (RQC) complex YloA/Tae2 family protein